MAPRRYNTDWSSASRLSPAPSRRPCFCFRHLSNRSVRGVSNRCFPGPWLGLPAIRTILAAWEAPHNRKQSRMATDFRMHCHCNHGGRPFQALTGSPVGRWTLRIPPKPVSRLAAEGCPQHRPHRSPVRDQRLDPLGAIHSGDFPAARGPFPDTSSALRCDPDTRTRRAP